MLSFFLDPQYERILWQIDSKNPPISMRLNTYSSYILCGSLVPSSKFFGVFGRQFIRRFRELHHFSNRFSDHCISGIRLKKVVDGLTVQHYYTNLLNLVLLRFECNAWVERGAKERFMERITAS